MLSGKNYDDKGEEKEIEDLYSHGKIKAAKKKEAAYKAERNRKRNADLVELKRLQQEILDHERYTQLVELTARIAAALAAAKPGDNRDDIVMRTASDFAIGKRYKVIKIKPQYTSLGYGGSQNANIQRLPIAIPVDRIKKVKKKVFVNGVEREVVVEVAKQTPFQALRDSQLHISNDTVDWGSFPQNSNQSYVGFHGEAKRWFEMVDLNDNDAIFAPIHNPDVQEKAFVRVPVNIEGDNIVTWVIRRRINLINLKKGFAGDDEIDSDKPRRGLLQRFSEYLPLFGQVSDTRGATFEVGVALDKHLREGIGNARRVGVAEIPEYELVSESEDKKDAKPAGLGFPDVVQYAAKYLYGKSPDPLLLLEMFRDNCQGLEAIIAEEALVPDAEAKKNIEHRMKTAVPDFLRRAMDEKLAGDAEVERLTAAGKANADIRAMQGRIAPIDANIKQLNEDLEGEQVEANRRSIESQIGALEKQKAQISESSVAYMNNERDKKFAKSRAKRAENEVIVGLFWMAVDAYLDQYAFDMAISDNLPLDTNYGRRELMMKQVDTISGAKPMNFVDREIFVQYVAAMIDYFGSSKFAVGNERPTNLHDAGDVYKMMERKGIIGSTQQILVDLHFYEGEGYEALLKKSEASAKGK